MHIRSVYMTVYSACASETFCHYLFDCFTAIVTSLLVKDFQHALFWAIRLNACKSEKFDRLFLNNCKSICSCTGRVSLGLPLHAGPKSERKYNDIASCTGVFDGSRSMCPKALHLCSSSTTESGIEFVCL